ncbi:hypothetical protein [Zavarzinia sp. CC-PAN008]|uniref:hypothetical protein n=1 Tax=Zavarzinia sp. CC-PAN008 TaxID=3243332 RepID=UPI003F742667
MLTSGSQPFTIYGLIGPDDAVFYVGMTRNLRQRVYAWRSRLRGIPNLRHVVLATAQTEAEALQHEHDLVEALTRTGTVLLNKSHFDRRDRSRAIRTEQILLSYMKIDSRV